MSTYDVQPFNTNRTVSFTITSTVANTFGFLADLPAGTTITDDHRLAQLRTNAMVTAMADYAVLVGASVDPSFKILTVTFETAVNGAFEVGGANSPADLVDTLGTGGMSAPKTKDGLTKLAVAALASKVGTDGVTTLFDGATKLADGSGTGLAAVAAADITVAAV